MGEYHESELGATGLDETDNFVSRKTCHIDAIHREEAITDVKVTRPIWGAAWYHSSWLDPN